MTRLVVLNHANESPVRSECPVFISVIENKSLITVKTHDILAGYDFYNITPDQGCHIWTIDRDTFWDDKPYLPNKAGIFGFCGWNVSDPILPNIGYTGAYISYSLQAMFFYDTGNTIGPYPTFMEAADPKTRKCIGLAFLRRHNAVETAEDIIVIRAHPEAHIQTNLQIEIMADEDWFSLHDKNIPFTINYTGPTAVGNFTNLTFTVAADVDPFPSEWGTFYVKTDKGYAPKTISITNKIGLIPFDATAMNSGETATIKVGLDFIARSRTFTVTKV